MRTVRYGGGRRSCDRPRIVTVLRWWFRLPARRRTRSWVPAVISLLGLLAAIVAARVVQLPDSGPQAGQPLAIATGNATPDALRLPTDLPVVPSTVAGSSSPTLWVPVPAASATGAAPSATTTTTPAHRPSTSATSPQPVTVPVPTTTSRAPAPRPSTPAAVTCRAVYSFDSVWNGGFVASITLTNTSGAAWSGWWGSFGMSTAAGVTNSWNATLRASGGWVTATPADYNRSVPAGGQVQFGFQASTAAPVNQLGPFSVNGQACG